MVDDEGGLEVPKNLELVQLDELYEDLRIDLVCEANRWFS